MLRIICPEPNRFQLEDVPLPVAGPGEALVKIKRIGICGSDIHAYRGRQPFFTYPRVFGHELAGKIVNLEDDTTGLMPGDSVVINPYFACGRCIACRRGRSNCCTTINLLGVHIDGGFQEYLAIPTANLLPAPDLSKDQAALVECLAIGAHAVQRAAPLSGEWALVIGAGPIGWGTIAFARLAGQKVIVLDTDPKRVALCRQHLASDHTLVADDRTHDTIATITSGEFVSVIYDATGNSVSMNSAVNFLAHTGRLVFIGHHKGNIEIADPEFHKREATLLGSRNATYQDLRRVMSALAEDKIDIAPLITHRTTLKQLPEEIENWLLPTSGLLKGIVEL